MFKVFVSYSSLDILNVAELELTLSGTGVEVYVAEHSLLPGESISDAITDAINSCDLFILLWSSNAKGSQWVQQEIGVAHSLKKPIIPLVLTEGLNLPGFISSLKYIPVYYNPNKAAEQVRSLVLNRFNEKAKTLKKQKEKDNLILFGLGALILWAFSQK